MGARRTLQQAAGNQAVAAVVGGSAPLERDARAALEREYDVDLGRVRVHSGAEAGEQTRVRGAAAFTRGHDVYVDDSAVRDPVVLGHELVHVIQQLRPAPRSAGAALESEASAVSEGAGDGISGGASFGAVQTFWPFDDDEAETQARERQRRDEQGEVAVKNLRILESTEEWKKYIDDPLIGGWLRDHAGRFDPRGENSEFQRWLANPKDRPSGSTSKPEPTKPSQLKEATGPPRLTGETEAQRRMEKAVWKSWTPRQKAMWARGLIEGERRKHFESMIPEKGSVGEAVWTLGEETGIHSVMRAWTGETEWAQPLTGEERFSEAVLGGAKVVQTGLLIAGAVPELGPVEGGAVVPRYADELLAGGGRETLTMLPTEAQTAERGAEALGRGGQTVEDLAKSAEGKFVKGEDVVLPQQPFGQPLGPPEFPPQIVRSTPPPGAGAARVGSELETGAKGAQTTEDLARGAQSQYVKGQDVAVPQQSLFEPPKATTPSKGLVIEAAPEVQTGGGTRLQPKVTPKVVPDVAPTSEAVKPTPKLQTTPELAGETGAVEKGWTEAEAQAAKERFGPKPDIPMPVSPSTEVEAAKRLARSGAQAAPLIDKEERKFPAAEDRPPITEKEERPPIVIDPEKREKVEAPPAISPEEGKKELPSEKKPGEDDELLAAAKTGKKKKSQLDKKVDKALKEPKGKVDVRKTPPEAEEVKPQQRELALTKKQKDLLSEYEQLGTEKVPDMVREILGKQKVTPARKRLGVLRNQWEDLMRKVGDRATLTTAERKQAEKILTEARELSGEDFDNLRDSVSLRMRRDPDLLKLEQTLRKAGVVGPGKGALQIPVRPIGEPSGKQTWESLNLEHRVRRSDDPWLYNDPGNLIVTDPIQNQQYLEAIRQHGIWPTTETEEFVTRHGLSAQPFNFAPGERPIGVPEKP